MLLVIALTVAAGSMPVDHTCPISQIVHSDGCCQVRVPPKSPQVTPDRGLCVDEDVIDVLWVYTPAALEYMGSAEEVLLQCQIAVDKANEAFINSSIPSMADPFSVRIVGLHATDYIEHGGDYLGHITIPGDGYMDEVHAIRDAKAADIVVLITVEGYCGLAYVAPSSPQYGFQECSAGCLVADWAHPFRHELGHNLGSQHFVTDTYGYFSWSSGHRLTPLGGTEIGTSMGGNDIPHFSNPNVSYGGAATGVAIGPDEEADNYSAFLVTVPMVADFRCSTDACAADVNLDGRVGVADLLQVIAQWGQCLPCSGDVEFDGHVGVNDLLAVVGAWGDCN